ncbi:TadE/TadG family type IV pilus assembly protein [Oricola cellulosilytica]|uniref:Pilus assembly protein n=1 Tax=Oricola cellulosilytica TaxID=1429082 RepID=A0A4R0PFM9_9HYPH|nr:TadE/TadG family type IV pilus assembly protein [Oricola cellulosilytica]TCD15468.1 pilus assembly protein [Oricola cellulosilytica]
MQAGRYLTQFLKGEDGTAAVEFAIVANIFIAIVLGIFAIGYAFVVKSDIEQSITVAERYALINEESDAQLENIIRSSLPTYDGSQITISLERGSSSGILYVRAEIAYVIDLGISSIFGPVSIATSRIFPT